MGSRNNVVRAVGALLAILLGLGAYKMYQRGLALQGDLVITGRTPATPAHPAVQSAPPPSPGPPPRAATPPSGTEVAAIETSSSDIVVHVAGAVRKPGLYHLPLRSRVDDALRAAGGAKADANLDAINLAAHAEDGTQLYVPTKAEQPQGGAPADAPASSAAGARHAPGASAHSSGHSQKLSSAGQGTVNINTASAEDLQKLPGVGPSYALRIIEFRKENGAFTNIEQLMDVSGIGEKKFEKMRPFVRIK